MKKIGLFINSTITVADFEKIAKPFLGNEEIELFSNFEHPSVNFIERKSTLSFQTNASLRKKYLNYTKNTIIDFKILLCVMIILIFGLI